MKDEKTQGVSTIEMLIVIAIVGFLVILIASIPNSIALVGRARHQSMVREIINKEVEDIRDIGYINLANGTQPVNDSRLSSLPQGEGQTIIEDCDVTICTQSEDVKKVTIKISWKEQGKLREESVTTLISDGGLN